MRILLATGIYPPDAGGPATYTQNIARAFIARGHEVEVVCYSDKGYVGESDDFSVHRISRRYPLPFRYIVYAWKVFLRALHADIVYLQGPVSEGFPGTIGAIFAGKPRVMKIVGDYAWEVFMSSESGKDSGELLDDFLKRSYFRKRSEIGWITGLIISKFPRLNFFLSHFRKGKIGMLTWIERWTAVKASRVIVPSNYLKTVVEKWFSDVERASSNPAKVTFPNINVIYNSVSLFQPSASREELRSQFQLNEKRVLFTAVRCVPWKNIDFIIQLMPELPPDIVFVIAGDGPMLSSWKSLVNELSLQNRVRFVGRLSRTQMGDWYYASDLFVLPSGYEGFPHVIPEAVSCGLPCFVSDKGGNPETHLHIDRTSSLERRITVLPYLDRNAWLKALAGSWGSVQAMQLPPALTEESMIHAIEDVLKDICKR